MTGRRTERSRLTPGLRAVAVLASGIGLICVAAAPAHAHPLGNFTRNVYAGITVTPTTIRIDHVIDLAEIPTFSERQGIDTDHDGTLDPAETRTYQDLACRQAAGAVRLTVDDRRRELLVDSAALSFPPGAGGLPTLRLECALSATLDGAGHGVAEVDDTNQGTRLGWHELTARGDGVRLTAPGIPVRSASDRLTRYPVDLLTSPLAQRATTLSWTVTGTGGSLTSGQPKTSVPTTSSTFGPVDAATRAYTDLIGRQRLTLPFALLALLLAVGLGGLHALAPGHGKTIMAGSLVGAGSRLREAVIIGLSVTVTHTTGVVLLGALLVFTARFAPETVYPWMTIVSGLLALTVGAALLRTTSRRLRDARRTAEPSHAEVRVPATVGAGPQRHPNEHDQPGGGASHSHGPSHGHSHGPSHGHGHGPSHGHGHGHSHEGRSIHSHGQPSRGLGLKGLLSLGLAGGLVPSPSALLVLLAGFSLHRAWFALLLVVAYGLGMALALSLIGLLLIRARDLIEKFGRGYSAGGRVSSALALLPLLPLLAAAVVVLAGTFLVIKGVVATGI